MKPRDWLEIVIMTVIVTVWILILVQAATR